MNCCCFLRRQGFCESVIPLIMNPAHFKAIISCITAVIPSSSLPNSVGATTRICACFLSSVLTAKRFLGFPQSLALPSLKRCMNATSLTLDLICCINSYTSGILTGKIEAKIEGKGGGPSHDLFGRLPCAGWKGQEKVMSIWSILGGCSWRISTVSEVDAHVSVVLSYVEIQHSYINRHLYLLT